MKYEIKVELLEKIIEKQDEIICQLNVLWPDSNTVEKLQSELATLKSQLPKQKEEIKDEVCVSCDKKVYTHNLCIDCLKKLIDENREQREPFVYDKDESEAYLKECMEKSRLNKPCEHCDIPIPCNLECEKENEPPKYPLSDRDFTMTDKITIDDLKADDNAREWRMMTNKAEGER